MKLSKKTFLYSAGISALLVGLVVVYFVVMLPPLYVDYMKEQNLEGVVAVEKGYIENRTYKGLNVPNPTATATLELPLSGDRLFLVGKAFKITMELRDEKLKKFFGECREVFQSIEQAEAKDLEKIDWELLKTTIEDSLFRDGTAPIRLSLETDENEAVMKDIGSGKVHIMEGDIFVYEGSATDNETEYTTYIAVARTEESVVFTILPVMTPQMKEIKPIVLGSIPMIAAVLFFVVLICSQYFSGKIVNPVIRLASYAEEVKRAEDMEIEPFEVHGQDEVAELGRTLNELYAKLRMNMERLKTENKRQEVFLRASSHQLKTPITAAMLLVDGMIQEVGKYKDSRAYLPQVKEQLLSMRKIVEDILYLNHCAEHLKMEEMDVGLLVWEMLSAYRVQIEERRISVETDGGECIAVSDPKLFKKIVDNLLANAVSYTGEGGFIKVELQKNALVIINEKAHIEEELLPHIYEPFVSSMEGQKGKGLGLYVASYYSGVLGVLLSVENEGDGVVSKLSFPNR